MKYDNFEILKINCDIQNIHQYKNTYHGLQIHRQYERNYREV